MTLARHVFLFSLIFLFTLALYVSAGMPSHAQTGFGPGQQGLTLSPDYPAPNSIAQVGLNAGTSGLLGATIQWFLDDTELTSYRNSRSVSVPVGGLGSPEKVSVYVVRSNGSTVSLSKTITPVSVDMVVEANTTVPTFYKGRSLPTQGASIRVVAVPHTGKRLDYTALSYQWEVDGKILYGGPVTGKQAANISIPFVGKPLVSVTIFDHSGTEIAQKSIRVFVQKPELYFYKENPLRSTNRVAFDNTYTLKGNEMTVRAEPYFMNPDVFSSNWVYDWRLNGKKVADTNPDPSLLTLRQTGPAGKASVSFELTNKSSLLQTANKTFTVLFGQNQ